MIAKKGMEIDRVYAVCANISHFPIAIAKAKRSLVNVESFYESSKFKPRRMRAQFPPRKRTDVPPFPGQGIYSIVF